MKDYISCHPDWQQEVTDILIQGSDKMTDIPHYEWDVNYMDDLLAAPDVGHVSAPCFSGENSENLGFEIGEWEPEKWTAPPHPSDFSVHAAPSTTLEEAMGDSNTRVPTDEDSDLTFLGWWTCFCPVPFK